MESISPKRENVSCFWGLGKLIKFRMNCLKKKRRRKFWKLKAPEREMFVLNFTTFFSSAASLNISRKRCCYVVDLDEHSENASIFQKGILWRNGILCHFTERGRKKFICEINWIPFNFITSINNCIPFCRFYFYVRN